MLIDNFHSVYICNECEGRMLISCVTCPKSFQQPLNYYGFAPSECAFMHTFPCI